jgi:hypothetical protein
MFGLSEIIRMNADPALGARMTGQTQVQAAPKPEPQFTLAEMEALSVVRPTPFLDDKADAPDPTWRWSR